MNLIYMENVRIPSERAHAYQIVQTCASLARLGHHVTLVNPERAPGQNVFAWFGLDKNLFSHVRLSAWDPLSSSFPLKAVTYALQRRFFTRALRRWAKNAQADVWYTRDTAMIDALRGVVQGPWILESHDTPDADPARWARVQPLISGHVAISNGMAERLTELGVPRERILVAHDGFDPDEFHALPSRAEVRRALGLDDRDFVALYIGSFYPWKGVEMAVESWGETPHDHHLVLVGGPDGERERIRARIPGAARERVHLLPTRPRGELTRLLPAANVGLIMSSPEYDIARRYTSPLKQFEYLAAGLPVLASDVPSSHEILTDATAVFFQPTGEGFRQGLEEARRRYAYRPWDGPHPEHLADHTWHARAVKIAEFVQDRCQSGT